MSQPEEISTLDPGVSALRDPSDPPPDPVRSAQTLLDILRRRASNQPGRLAYRFLLDGASEEACLTYGALDLRARRIANRLRSSGAPGDRVILVYPPGLDFVCALFGCWQAGMIAVPAYPPRPGRVGYAARSAGQLGRPVDQATQRLVSAARDAQPAAVLTLSALGSTIEALAREAPELRSPDHLLTDLDEEDPGPACRDPDPGREDIALLQYTSGSTAAPRGVMITHGNLMHNLSAIQERFGTHPDSRGLMWTPPYHDMGLIGGILKPAYTGMQVTLMSPLHLLQRPLRWLQAVSRYRATVSGGPDFAYALCVAKISPEERDRLDLGSWEVAFNGAEPIRPATLRQFAAYFEPCGFRAEAFYPCYGLAEATLMVSGGERHRPPVARRFHVPRRGPKVETRAEDEPGARTIVGCGRTIGDQRIVITDPETGAHRGTGRIGEIRVSGPSVARGYWNRPEESRRVFGALPDGSSISFLRTGDLGFLLDDELFIVGRLKDLIIIDGRNHYPEDIEQTVAESHEAVRAGACAAFSIDTADGERLVIVGEIRRRPEPDREEIVRAIRAAVSSRHDLHVHDIVLLVDGRVSRTPSGKIRRHACRQAYLGEAPARERVDS